MEGARKRPELEGVALYQYLDPVSLASWPLGHVGRSWQLDPTRRIPHSRTMRTAGQGRTRGVNCLYRASQPQVRGP